MIRKAYKFRLYPSRSQVAQIEEQLAEACYLYNAALQERRDAWRINHTSVSLYDQSRQIKEIRASGDLGIHTYDVSQEVLQRVDKAFKQFYRRLQSGERVGYPRFRSSSRYDSITFTHYGNGCKLVDSGKFRVQGIGLIKVKLHRSIEGKIKRATIKREAGLWYVSLIVECESKLLPVSNSSVGLDVGLSTFATLSDGSEIENPRFNCESQNKLRRAQRKVSRRKKGSKRRRKAVLLLQRTHAHIRNQRAGFHHTISRELINSYGLIAVEDLNIKGMARGILAKSVTDAAWSSFIFMLSYKAEEAGRKLIKVDSRGTSQRCICGAPVKKTIKQRWHECHACGLSVGRDHASALEILRLGLSLQTLTCPVADSVV